MDWEGILFQKQPSDGKKRPPCRTFDLSLDESVRKYVCGVCSNSYKKGNYLRRHKKKNHPHNRLTQKHLEERDEMEASSSEQGSTSSEYRCDYCDSIYLCSYTYHQHARIHRWLEDIEHRDFSLLTSARSCQTAGRTFYIPQAYLCKICSRALDTEPLYHAHIQVCQKHRPRFSNLNSNLCCYVCGQEFKKYLQLRKHKTLYHLDTN